jgi:hypothetical protein
MDDYHFGICFWIWADLASSPFYGLNDWIIFNLKLIWKIVRARKFQKKYGSIHKMTSYSQKLKDLIDQICQIYAKYFSD